MGINPSKKPHLCFLATLLLISVVASHALYPFLPETHNQFYDALLGLLTLSPLFVAGSLYALFDRYGWRYRIFRWVGVVNVPDLNGCWKGTHRSSHIQDGKNVVVDAYLEIVQTFSKITVHAYYEKSESYGVVAGFGELGGEIYLYYIYDNEPNSLKGGGMQNHRGTVKLKCLPNERKLIGTYFNSIGNSGDVQLDFKNRVLLGRFDTS